MEKSQGPPYRKVIVGLLGICLIGAAVVLGGFVFGDLKELILSLTGHKAQLSNPASVQITYVTKYLKCGDISTVSEQISRDEVDAFIATLSEEWNAVGREDSGIQLLRTIDDYCPFHAKTRLITLSHGYVAVYRGNVPDAKFLIKEYKDLRESNLDPKCRSLLEKGVLVEDEPDVVDEKVRLYLEGIID